MKDRPIELDDAIHCHVKELCGEGDALAKAERFLDAAEKYQAALKLLPEPVHRWTAATWVFTALGDVSFLSGDFERARTALLEAMHCPGGIGNPFIHLRIGQAQFELGNEILALDELTRAYMGGGKEVFRDEDDKYFAMVKQNLKQPPNGW